MHFPDKILVYTLLHIYIHIYPSSVAVGSIQPKNKTSEKNAYRSQIIWENESNQKIVNKKSKNNSNSSLLDGGQPKNTCDIVIIYIRSNWSIEKSFINVFGQDRF